MRLPRQQRERAVRLLLILSVLRLLEESVEKEVAAMPVEIVPQCILIGWQFPMKSHYLRGLIERGRQEGRQEGPPG